MEGKQKEQPYRKQSTWESTQPPERQAGPKANGPLRPHGRENEFYQISDGPPPLVRHPWISTDIHGYQWISKDVHESFLKSMDTCGNLLISKDFHVYPWITKDIHAYSQISKHIQASPWISKDIHGFLNSGVHSAAKSSDLSPWGFSGLEAIVRRTILMI